MAIGRPIELTPNITSKNISIAATEGQTDFTVTGGYRINEIAVYRNGVRLVDGRDFSATDGQTVTLISDTVDADDVLEFSVFDSFDIAGVIVGAASSQAVNGNLHVTGELYAGTFVPTSIVATSATFNSALHVGSALTANAAGDVETIGIITAATFKGDGSGLTGIGETVNVRTNTITVSGVSTFTGAVNVDATTDSTSTTTGALIVDGGVGIAKNVYIGAGLSVAGTLTYEDVTSVDSVGLITAKSGVNITGGELKVGTAVTIGSAGIITSMGGTLDLKNSGSVSNIKLYCESGNSHYTQIQSAAHGSYSGNVTLTLPTTTDTLIGRTTTDTLTNKTLTSPTINTLSGDTASFSSNLTVGSGITFGSAGVATFSGTSDVHLHDNVKLNVGDGSDLQVYFDGTNGYIKGGSSGELVIRHDAITMQAASSTDTYFDAAYDGSVSLFYNNSKKFETSNDGTVTTGISTATAFVPTEGQLSNRNIIINGDMAIWQRGTTAINSSVNKYLVDRFKVLSVSDGDGSISQHTNVPTQVQTGGVQFAYSLRLNCTTADTSLAANQYIIVSQRVEGRNLRHLGFGLAGTRYATLQFWQRSPAGTYYVSFRNGSYNRYYLGAYTIASANTWEKHSITIPIDTQGTWASDHSTGLDIQWSLGTGSATGSVGSWTGGSSHAGTGQKNFFDTVGNDFYLTGVQFEAGSVATPFESIDYGSELAKCQRYYYPITAPEGFINATEDIGIGRPNSSTEVQLRVSPPAQMRATPSVEATTGSQYFRISNGNLGGDKYLSNAWIINNMSPTGGFLYTQPDDNLGSYIGESATVQSKSTSARLALKSEL